MKLYFYVKLIFDFVLSSFLLVFLFPVMIVCAIIIKIEDPKGPVLFIQKRVGYQNKTFSIFKFRSMKVQIEDNGVLLNDSERMLKFSGVFRKLSLDEIPQLINVLKGEMSFIGPRPLPVLYFPYFNKNELLRHNVKPGISGWAQVNGRNNLGWEEKFALDIYYVSNASFIFDLKILLLTVLKVISKSDVVVRGQNEVMDFHTFRILQSNKMGQKKNCDYEV
ncbi:sugar transferase [Shewanella sp. KX20019]|uniref:sugar transferase n=1 Tax=Shewanella sp. KX20019 TaxID=2803864 RepID=UPI001928CF06|nr:sugar transferase [Shewanella sp. KX20019]QQX81814.1 sugar transferase [Shewanella sp. KX20019]